GVDPAVLDAGEVTPATGALRLVGANRRGAREATDGGKPHGMKGIEGDVRVVRQVTIERLARHRGEGMHPERVELGIEPEAADLGAGAALVASERADQRV